MITFSNIVDRFEKFVENHFFLKTFSFGSPEDLDLSKFENYPLLHLVYTSADYVDKVKSYSLSIYIMDCPRGEDKRKEFERDVITSTELVAEDILADLENGGNIFDFDFSYILESASSEPLEEEGSNVLSGTLLQVTIGVPYLYDSCNAPLTGVSPQGTNTSFSARGLLRVKEIDGTPDVTTVKTINVSNGTLTDDGNGVVTIDTSGTTPTGITAGLVGTYKYSGTEAFTNTSGTFASGVFSVVAYNDSSITFDNRNLVGSQVFIHNFSLNRREVYGLSSGATVRVKYTINAVYDAAGVVSITSTASNPSISVTRTPSGASSETINIDETFTNSAQENIFLNLQALVSMNCTLTITTFEVIITNPS